MVDKPIKGHRTALGKVFDDFYKETLPIHYWCQQQAKKNKKIKI